MIWYPHVKLNFIENRKKTIMILEIIVNKSLSIHISFIASLTLEKFKIGTVIFSDYIIGILFLPRNINGNTISRKYGKRPS